MSRYEDEQLEQRLREGLQQRAEMVDVSAPVAARARARARRRRAGLATVGIAAASVVAVAAMGIVLRGDDTGRDPDPPPVVDSSDKPTEWRTEYWHGLRVEVPADWGWGAAPDACGVGAVVGAEGGRGVDFQTTPYVGRPISNTDVCGGPPGAPQAPYVWLGADVEPGTVDLGGGYLQQTVEVEGTTLTVASDGAELREHVLGSAARGELCKPQAGLVPEGKSQTTVEGVGSLKEAFVCAYARGDDQLFRPVAASRLPLADFQRLERLLQEAPEHPAVCKDVPEYAVVTGWYADPYTDDREMWLRQDRVFELSCGVVDLGDAQFSDRPQRVRATDAAIDIWRGGVYDVSLQHFIGPQG